ncbi:MAG TPA: hypothetical protein VEB21_19955 [Terriglobales bacterium]|nr:hypothetical protein [Terriglobales bacterium]
MRSLFAMFALIVMLYPSFASAQAAPPVPDTIPGKDGRLAWVSARHALDESGRLKTELVDSPLLRANARLNRKQNEIKANDAAAEECKTFLGTYLENFKPTNSLKEAVDGAEMIVSGRVLSIEEGFLHNLPGSLLRLSGSAIKGTNTDEIFVFYPLARIRTANGLVCTRPVGAFQPPAVGDQLVVFSMSQPLVTENRTVLQVDPVREIVHQGVSGQRVVPAAFVQELGSGLTFEQLERRVVLESKSARRSQ